MNHKKRVIYIILGLALLTGVMFLIEYLRGVNQSTSLESDLQPGDVPIFWNGKFNQGFSAAQLDPLPKASFVDAEEGKPQEGWLLKDVLLSIYKPAQFSEDITVTIISSSREKEVRLTWAEIDNVDNMVMFDLSGRGTLKLVSKLERLDVRDEWIQDVDKIEINNQ